MYLDTPLKLVLIVVLFLLSQQFANAQKKFSIVKKVEDSGKNFSVSSGMDFSVLKISPHVCFNFNNKIGLGFEIGAGINATNYRIAAGAHFGASHTPIVYEERDNRGQYMFINFADASVFLRMFLYKKYEFDVGFHNFVFIHGVSNDDDFAGGLFTGGYIRYMFPTNFKQKENKVKRRISGGIQITAGNLKEYSETEFLVMGSLMGRIYFNYSKYKK